jgi:peptidoglycan/xylan/chitin deacetylase (PgdA/CDA1 family)
MRHLGPVLLLSLCFGIHLAVKAAGPAEVAKADFSLWPHAIDNHRDFDLASRAELIVSANTLDKLLKKELTAADLHIKEIQRNSLQKWQDNTRRIWLTAFQDASKSCTEKALGCGYAGTNWIEFIKYTTGVEAEMSDKAQYREWLSNTRKFHEIYLNEQMRLAALFPNPTSEILTLDASEVTGDEYADGQFALSLDDGPTIAGGDTDHYVEMLRHQHISATFFALGNALELRLHATSPQALQSLYQGQCLGSHGYEHKSHQKWTDWKISLDKTHDLIHQVYPEQKSIMFRPPYGQRHGDLLNYLKQGNAKVVLWNIDSQDWHNKISTEEVAARIKKLMLLKRRGMILFHDVHKKGLVAIPEIVSFVKQAGLSWLGCEVSR